MDSSAISHGIQLAVAPVFMLSAVAALICFLAETLLASHTLRFAKSPPRK